MSNYDDGYEKGHKDAIEGKPTQSSSILFAMLSCLNDEEQNEYEEGYRDGYEAGEEDKDD